MGRHFEQRREEALPATPEQVWDAIATGPGITSWFMGRSEVEDGAVRTVFGDYAPELPVSAAERPSRFAYGSEPAPDGRFIAYEFLVEARDGGSAVIRTVTSGFLPGDDWADEYEAMTLGSEFYFRTLVAYVTSFAGRYARPVTAFGPEGRDWGRTRAAILRRLGLADPVAVGDAVHADLPGIGRVDGSVYAVNARTLGVRTDDALLRFIEGFGKGHIAGHLLFGAAASGATESDPVESGIDETWRAWMDGLEY
jgi:uncharacterized protein YndB with AHSA1/START domain